MCFALETRKKIQHMNEFFINIAEFNWHMPVSFTYFDDQISSFSFEYSVFILKVQRLLSLKRYI